MLRGTIACVVLHCIVFGERAKDLFGMHNLKARNYHPTWAIDVGANKGSFGAAIARLWPGTATLMLEASDVYHPDLIDTVSFIEGQCQMVRSKCRDVATIKFGIVGDVNNKSIEFNTLGRGDSTGSSIYRENSDYAWKRVTRTMYTLDYQTQRFMRDNTGMGILKIDVQGAEMLVLGGAGALLKKTDVIIMEVAVMQYNKGAPMLAEMVIQLRSFGFIVWRMINSITHKNNVAQLNVIFARHDGILYDPEQTKLPRPEYPITDPSVRKHTMKALFRLIAELSGHSDPAKLERAMKKSYRYIIAQLP